jgi:hypothetical protein
MGLTAEIETLYWWVLFMGWRATSKVAARSLSRCDSKPDAHAAVAQLVERVLGKDEVKGSNPFSSFRTAHVCRGDQRALREHGGVRRV